MGEHEPGFAEPVPDSDQLALGEQEKTREKNPHSSIEFLGEELSEKFESPSLLKSLRLAARITQQTGKETAIRYMTFGDKSTYVPGVVEAESVSDLQVNPNDEPTTIVDGSLHEKPENQGQNIGILMDLHFHPAENEDLLPSGDDLRHLVSDSRRTSWEPGSIGIGRIGVKGDIDILVLRAIHKITGVDIEVFDDEQHNFSGAELDRIINLLAEMGIEARMIRYDRYKGRYALSEDSKKELLSMSSLKVKLYQG